MLLVSAAPGLRVPRGHGAGSCYSQSASLPLPLPLNHNNALIQLQSAKHAAGNQPTVHSWRRRPFLLSTLAVASAEQQASAGPELTGGDDGKLEAFISWLIANGEDM